MIAATARRDDARTTRMLHLDRTGEGAGDRRIGDLRAILAAGDLLVVNDAATLPSSLIARTVDGAFVEVRLAGESDRGGWRAILFGDGDWRTRTEDRLAPPPLRAGDTLRVDDETRATVVEVDRAHPRLVTLDFGGGAAAWRAFYRAGRPVQYAYTTDRLDLWSVQTGYGARPWASEAPSAGFALSWELLIELRRRGIGIARVTHAAGLSSTGEIGLDGRLPLPERFEVPARTADAVTRARARGARVIAAGTSTTRALEASAGANGGRVAAGNGMTALRLGPRDRLHAVTGILTGMHEPGTSHFELLEAFVPSARLIEAYETAIALGYRGHEFGDTMLIA